MLGGRAGDPEEQGKLRATRVCSVGVPFFFFFFYNYQCLPSYTAPGIYFMHIVLSFVYMHIY